MAERIDHDAPTYVEIARKGVWMANQAAEHEVSMPDLLADRVTGLRSLVELVAEQVGHVADTTEILPVAARDNESQLASADDTTPEQKLRDVLQDLRAAAAELTATVDTLEGAHAQLSGIRMESQ